MWVDDCNSAGCKGTRLLLLLLLLKYTAASTTTNNNTITATNDIFFALVREICLLDERDLGLIVAAQSENRL
jgi:hypothetical protein